MQPLPDMNQLRKLAASPAGQKLMAMLQNNKDIDLTKLARSASAGNLDEAKRQLSFLLSSKEANDLLKELENPHE